MGVYGMLHRKNPVDEHIGYVYLNYAENKQSLKGYVVERMRSGKSQHYDEPDIKSYADNMCIISRKWDQENKDDMSISYIGDKISASYSTYDADFNPISEDIDMLKIPGDDMSKYYVSFDVKWGNEDENVTVRYYFSVEFN